MIDMIDDEKLKEYRHKVLQRVNHTDILVSGIICNYYFKIGGIPLGFLSTVLYQEPLSFSSRIKMLRNILKEMEQTEKDKKDLINKIKNKINNLDEMAKIRNDFAHCELIIKIGEEEEHFFNPKHYHESIDFEKEFQEFNRLDAEVNPILFNLFEEMGGKYYKDKPEI